MATWFNEVSSHNPRHWWRLLDAAVANVLDVGNQSNVDFQTEIGAITESQTGPLASGQTTAAMGFDGNDGLHLDSGQVSSASAGAVVFWAKKAGLSSGGGAAICFTIGQSPSGNQLTLFRLDIESDGTFAWQVRLTTGGTTQMRIKETTPVDTTTWHMYAIVTAGSSHPILYKDGVLIASTVTEQDGGVPDATWFSTLPGTFIHNSIGARVDNSVTPTLDGFFTGDLCELFIVDTQLTAQNILDLYNAGITAVGDAKTVRHRGRKVYQN